jgi:hypothetical protein
VNPPGPDSMISAGANPAANSRIAVSLMRIL